MAGSCWLLRLPPQSWLPHQHLNWGHGLQFLVSIRFPIPRASLGCFLGPFKSMFVICISHAFELTALAARILLLIIAIGQPANSSSSGSSSNMQQQHAACSMQHTAATCNSSSNASAFWHSPFHYPNIEFRPKSSSSSTSPIPNPHTRFPQWNDSFRCNCFFYTLLLPLQQHQAPGTRLWQQQLWHSGVHRMCK